MIHVDQLMHCLEANSEFALRMILPTGEHIPDHFHITEVGRIDKKFIDCGGTQRQLTSCLLQAWTANDIQHRLVAGKLAKILKIAEPVLGAADLPVEVEFGNDLAAHYVVSEIEVQDQRITFRLKGKQTDCLAQDRCGVGECSTPDCCV